MAQVCENDGSFGPAIGPCRGGFDFTLVFEESMLGLLPHAALLLLAPFRLATLRRRRHRVAKNSHLGFLKLIANVFYIASSVVLLAIWSETETYKTNLSIALASLEFLASLFIATLSRLEHSRAVRPSHLLQFFLLVLLLCDAVRLRTLCLMDYPTSLVTPASVHTFLIGLLLLLESLDKRDLFSSDQDRRLPPEETIGLFGQRLFWYLNGLFKEGYQKILKPVDLCGIDADLASKQRAIVFQNAWMMQDMQQSAPLARSIFKILWLDLSLPVIPRLLQMATTLSQPYLITSVIKFVQQRDDPNSKNIGYGLIAAFGLNYALLAIASSWCAQSVARFSTKLRGCLISLIYEKTLQSPSKGIDLGAATVLMNVDVEKLLSGCRSMHEIWAAILSTGIALYILYTHLGVAFVAPFLTISISTLLSTWIGRQMRARQLLWAAATQRRVTTISYVVGRMKGVRMLGLDETVFRMLTSLREVEVAAQRYIRKIATWVLWMSNCIFQLATLTTYVTFAVIMLAQGNGLGLDFDTLYGSLSALKLVTSPLMMVLQIIPTLQTSLASLDRIERFLKGESNEREALPTLGSTQATSDNIELLSIKTSRLHAPLVSMKSANFAIDTQPLLFDITTSLRSGSFTMLVGRVGSGKSVFLRSLVGETKLISGSFVSPKSGVAYCDQSVWLRNATIQENIVGEDLLDESWYNRVLWSCGLLQDLGEMKRGDNTPIGSQGISLSGGQKNRLALARALYARKPILALDDMLAGLDNTTEKLVFHRVFGPNGLLRGSNATVVLATHATHYARFADRLIVLSQGRIVEEGTYQAIGRRNIHLQKLNDSISDEGHETESSDDLESDSPIPTEPASRAAATVDEGTHDDVDRQSGDRKSLMFFIKAIGPLHVSIYWGLLTISTVATQIQFLWLKWWAESDNSNNSSVIRNLYIFCIITVVNIVLYFCYLLHTMLWFAPRISLNLHASQLAALMRAKYSWIASTDIGSITNRFSQDIVLVDFHLQSAWINATSELLVVISILAIMIVATPPIAATVPLLLGVGYCIQRVYLRTSRQVRLMDLEAKAPLCTHFLESLGGIVTIRAFGWASAYRTKNNAYLEQSQVPFYLLFAIQNWLNLVLELMVAGLITVIVGLAVGLRSKVDPGYLGVALVSAMDLGLNFRILIQYWTELQTSLSAVSRIRQFGTTPSESQGPTEAALPEAWPLHGSVAFNKLVASYSDGGKSVLEGIDLEIKAGERIGLCGRTGSGKSSLVATLFGLLHQQDGEILIDGIATTDVSLSVLRSKIIALPQEPFFLRGTLRHNLAPWSPEEKRNSVADDQMRDALQQVQLWDKLSAVAEAPHSVLDMNLDNVDSLLSQGERQLFCLARAILMDGKIVVLDEATSSVDAQTDALMQRILRTAFAGRTIIAIAHRLDTILDFDRVVVMDAGMIAEVGEPTKLLKTEGSLFRALVESQGKK